MSYCFVVGDTTVTVVKRFEDVLRLIEVTMRKFEPQQLRSVKKPLKLYVFPTVRPSVSRSTAPI